MLVLMENIKEYVSSYGEYKGADISKEDLIIYDLDYGAEELYKISNVKKVEELYKIFNNSEMREIFMEMFGNHVEVTATKEGFEIDNYDHD